MSKTSSRLLTGRYDRNILRAALAVTSAGILVKIVATAKEFCVAGIYGRSDAMDAFLVAALIPGLLVNLISESMNQALIPTFIRVQEREGRRQGQELLSSALLWSCVLLVGVSALMALTTHLYFPLIAWQFSPQKIMLAEHLFFGLLPIVLLSGIASNCTAVLNTQERFALPALAPIAVPLATVAGAFALNGRVGIWALVYGTVLGGIIHAVLSVRMMEAQGYRFRLCWYGSSKATLEVARQYGPVLLSSVVASGGLLVDQSMAAALPAGSVSALAYANRFVSVVITLLAGTLSSAVTPYFSTIVAEADWSACKKTLRTWRRMAALIAIPIALLIMLGAHPLVRLALQHGAFGSRDTAVVTRVLVMYAIQIPFFVCSRVYYRFLLAMRRTDLIFYCGSLNLALDIGLNLLFMRWMGVAGIALATSIWTVNSLLFLWYWTHKLLKEKTGLPR